MQEEITVLLNGEIDQHRSAPLKEELDRIIEISRPKCLILDFSAVTLMDSSGIGLLLGRYKRLKQNGGRLAVTRVTPKIEQIFRMSGLYQVIEKR